MNADSRQELLRRSGDLIERRVSEIEATATGGSVRISGGIVSVLEGAETLEEEQEKQFLFPGKLQLLGNRVFVVPFCVPNKRDLYSGEPHIPKIEGKSIFSSNRPSFPRLAGGGALYVEIKTTLVDNVPPSLVLQAQVQEVNIVQVAMSAPMPYKPGEVTYVSPFSSAEQRTVTDPDARMYAFLAAYTARGKVILPVTPVGDPPYRRSVSLTDPLDEGRGPHRLILVDEVFFNTPTSFPYE